MSGPVYLDCEALKETDDGLLVQLDTGEEGWVPRSEIHEDSTVTEEGDEGTLAIPEWLAIERGWV